MTDVIVAGATIVAIVTILVVTVYWKRFSKNKDLIGGIVVTVVSIVSSALILSHFETVYGYPKII